MTDAPATGGPPGGSGRAHDLGGDSAEALDLLVGESVMDASPQDSAVTECGRNGVVAVRDARASCDRFAAACFQARIFSRVPERNRPGLPVDADRARLEAALGAAPGRCSRLH